MDFSFDRDKANTNTADGYDSVEAGELIYGVVERTGKERRGEKRRDLM